MAWTEADLAIIDAAILQAAQGKTITFNNRSWTSQDLSELRDLRVEIAIQVTAATTGRRYRLAVTAKMGHPVDE